MSSAYNLLRKWRVKLFGPSTVFITTCSHNKTCERYIYDIDVDICIKKQTPEGVRYAKRYQWNGLGKPITTIKFPIKPTSVIQDQKFSIELTRGNNKLVITDVWGDMENIHNRCLQMVRVIGRDKPQIKGFFSHRELKHIYKLTKKIGWD